MVLGRGRAWGAICLVVCLAIGLTTACEKDGTVVAPVEKFLADMLFWHNQARCHPQEFAEEHLKPLLGQSSEMKECYDLMRGMTPVQALRLDLNLGSLAQEWARHLADVGEFAHRPDLFERTKASCSWVGESLSAGLADPKAIVIQLLEDKGVEGRGHRENLLKPRANILGVGYVEGEGAPYGFVTVLNYADARE